MAALTQRIRLLMAVRIGESWLPQLARQIATIDRMLAGRLTVNIISSDLPGETLDSAPRYTRTVEAMHILRTLLNGEHLSHRGEFWNLDLDPPRIGTLSGRCPPLYFGGLSPAAKEAAAQGCDVYLMWPDTLEGVRGIIADLRARAAKHERNLKFGFRVHVVVRDTEAEARAAADRLLSKLDAATGEAIRAKSLDSQSAGVARQAELREEPHGRRAISRRTCGPASAALVPAAARRSSVIPTRCSPSSMLTGTRGSRRSSCPDTLMRRKLTCSPATSCRV
jgi:alkanesulfonate monooxygenase